jgi:hypothetical protein
MRLSCTFNVLQIMDNNGPALLGRFQQNFRVIFLYPSILVDVQSFGINTPFLLGPPKFGNGPA